MALLINDGVTEIELDWESRHSGLLVLSITHFVLLNESFPCLISKVHACPDFLFLHG